MIYARKCTAKNGRAYLIPTSSMAEKKMAAWKDGKVVKVLETEDRNWALHDRYFATLHTVFDNQEQFASADTLREATLIEIGYCEMREKFNGERYYVAASMASGKMLPGWTMKMIYDRSVDVWCKHFGFDRAELEKEAA